MILSPAEAQRKGRRGSPHGCAAFLNAMSVASDIIWNFIDATSVTFNTQWGGTVLAANATVRTNTPLNGTLFANAYVGTGELHSRPFRWALPDDGGGRTEPNEIPAPAASRCSASACSPPAGSGAARSPAGPEPFPAATLRAPPQLAPNR